MTSKIIAAGAFAAIAGFAGLAYAQSTITLNSLPKNYTRSSESLQLENLTVEDNYQEFFKPGQNQEDVSLNTGNPYVYGDGDDGVWQISDRVQLQVNEPLSPPIFPVPFQREGASSVDDIDRVGVQYRLSE